MSLGLAACPKKSGTSSLESAEVDYQLSYTRAFPQNLHAWAIFPQESHHNH